MYRKYKSIIYQIFDSFVNISNKNVNNKVILFHMLNYLIVYNSILPVNIQEPIVSSITYSPNKEEGSVT